MCLRLRLLAHLGKSVRREDEIEARKEECTGLRCSLRRALREMSLPGWSFFTDFTTGCQSDRTGVLRNEGLGRSILPN